MEITAIYLLAAVAVAMLVIRKLILLDNVTIIGFIVMVLLTAVIPNAVFWIVYRKKEEYRYFKDILKNRIISPIRRKLH